MSFPVVDRGTRDMMVSSVNKPKTVKHAAKILIVVDHPLIRRGFVELIGAEPDLEVCGEAENAPEAMQQVAHTQPDLAIIDIMLKSGNGIELVKQIKAVNEKVKMLVYTMHEESLYAERALRAGAKGFINKEEACKNIIEAIRQILRGKVYHSGHMTERVLQQVVSGDPVEQSPVDSLSDHELEVFELIGQGLTTRQIATNLHLSVKTIETHRDNIKSKLHLKNGTQLTHRAVRWAVENH